MRFNLILHTISHPAILPVNYQYPLAAAIYKILGRADPAYATFLHEQGYHRLGSLKSFKLFTFSDLRTPFHIAGDRLHLKTNTASLTICFHLPKAAENFIKGLFIEQEIDIADTKNKVTFCVQQVEAVAMPMEENGMVLQPFSPIVCGRKNDRGNYDFLAPGDPDFIPQLLYNWREKYGALYNDADMGFADAGMEVRFYKNPPKSRLITIKADTEEATQVRGFVNFQLQVYGKKEALELLLNSGAGVYNSMGMGCIGMAN